MLYKKGDGGEIRNYRPITLLNTDGKAMTSALAMRLNAMMMSVNRSKTKSLALGSLRAAGNSDAMRAYSRNTASARDGIKWCPDSSYIRCLGIPIGNYLLDLEAFFELKYRQVKALICKWHRVFAADDRAQHAS